MPTDNHVNFREEVIRELENNYNRTPVQYPNQLNFDKPEDSAWVHLSFGEAEGQAIDIANKPTHRYPGVVAFRIHVPIEDGWRTAYDIADEIAGIFRQKTIDTTIFRSDRVDEIGRVENEEGAWFRVDLRIPYRRDSQFAVQ